MLKLKQFSKVDIKQNNISTVILSNKFLVYHTPPNLINIQGHELEGAFTVHTLACLESHGQITH